MKQVERSMNNGALNKQTVSATAEEFSDNVPQAFKKLLEENNRLRQLPWPAPYNRTVHKLHLGDARDLSWIADASVHLIVTSPPYWTLKEYNEHPKQLGQIEKYELFLNELERTISNTSSFFVRAESIANPTTLKSSFRC